MVFGIPEKDTLITFGIKLATTVPISNDVTHPAKDMEVLDVWLSSLPYFIMSDSSTWKNGNSVMNMEGRVESFNPEVKRNVFDKHHHSSHFLKSPIFLSTIPFCCEVMGAENS